MSVEETSAINIGFARLCLAIINRALLDTNLAAQHHPHAYSAREFLQDDNEFYQMYLAMVEVCAPEINSGFKEMKRDPEFY